MLILHGSATGTATDVAASLFRLARRYRIPDLHLSSLQDLDLVQLVESDLAVFVVSTTGNGDIPASMHGFWTTLLRSDVDAHLLEDLSFVIVGLGDSKYAQFNWTAKKLRRRLQQLGAHEALETTMCDESANEGQDTALLPFIKTYETLLRELNDDVEPIAKDVILPAVCPVQLVKSKTNGKAAEATVDKHGRFVASIKSNSRLTSKKHFQDVRLLTFDVTTSLDQTIEPGDVLSLCPINSDTSVDRFIELLGWKAHQDGYIQLPANSKASEFFLDPAHVTLHDFIKVAIPLNGVPSLNLFSQLVQFTEDENFREKFDEWEQADGKDDLYDYLSRPRRTLLEVIEDFAAGIKVPVEHCVDLFGLIVSRSYSIAGARSISKDVTNASQKYEIELLVALVQYQTRIKEPRQGLASRYIAQLRPNKVTKGNSSLLVKIEKPIIDANKMPEPPLSVPLLMICTGTGFAPLRFFITRLQRSGDAVVKKHDITLFFGCRSHEDNLVASTLRESIRETIDIVYAYSRLPETPRTYVQDLIPTRAEAIHSIIARSGRVYLCGSSGAMPDAVRAAMDTIIGPATSVPQLIEEGRWWQETW